MLDEITQRNASKSSHVFNMKMQARVFCVGKSTYESIRSTFFLKNVYLRRTFEAINVSIQNFAPFCRI